MISITDEMRTEIDNALANGYPCILATASPVGEPDVGLRGSMMVFDDESLAYWERGKRTGLANMEVNPNVVVMYRNPRERKAWKFYGEATVYRDGALREQIMSRVVSAELDRDQERSGFAVIIRVNRIVSLVGEVLQQRD